MGSSAATALIWQGMQGRFDTIEGNDMMRLGDGGFKQRTG